MDEIAKNNILDSVTYMLSEVSGLDGTLAVDRSGGITIDGYTEETVIHLKLTMTNNSVLEWCQNTDKQIYSLRKIWDVIESTQDSWDVIIALRAMCAPVQYEYLSAMWYEDGYPKLDRARKDFSEHFALAVKDEEDETAFNRITAILRGHNEH